MPSTCRMTSVQTSTQKFRYVSTLSSYQFFHMLCRWKCLCRKLSVPALMGQTQLRASIRLSATQGHIKASLLDVCWFTVVLQNMWKFITPILLGHPKSSFPEASTSGWNTDAQRTVSKNIYLHIVKIQYFFFVQLSWNLQGKEDWNFWHKFLYTLNLKVFNV